VSKHLIVRQRKRSIISPGARRKLREKDFGTSKRALWFAVASILINFATLYVVYQQVYLMRDSNDNSRRQAVFAKQFEYCQRTISQASRLGDQIMRLKPSELRPQIMAFASLANEASYVMPENVNYQLLDVVLSAESVLIEPTYRKYHLLVPLVSREEAGGGRGMFKNENPEQEINPSLISAIKTKYGAGSFVAMIKAATNTRKATEALASACTLNVELPSFDMGSKPSSRYILGRWRAPSVCKTTQNFCSQ
jgi:hypothetical protein